MPFDSEGKFTRVHNWEDDRVNDIDIVTDHADEEDDNFADGLSQTFLRDGRVAMHGNMDMANFQIKNLSRGALDGDAVNKKQVDEAVSGLEEKLDIAIKSVFSLGDIKASLQTANHGSWLLCNGQAVSRTDYADLFELIGTNFGTGDGVTTFNIPDYRGKFLRGLGGDSASDIYSTQEEGLPNITGKYQVAELTHGNMDLYTEGALYSYPTNLIPPSSQSGAPNSYGIGIDASKSSSVYGKSAHVTPINQAVNYFIKAKED